MKQTPARARFKNHFGQANHFLVTNLVALRHLESSDVICAPPELHTTWSPQSKQNSINRTWAFTLQTALTSAVDSIDMYISLLYRWPNYIRNQSLCSELDGAKNSVHRKVMAVSKHYGLSSVTTAMIDVLITWRNNVVHELAENDLRPETIQTLRDMAVDISNSYRGLNPHDLPTKAKKGDELTFKEAASLINAAHKFVEYVDQAVISKLDLESVCHDIIIKSLKEDPAFLNKYYALPIEKRRRFLGNFLTNRHGLPNIPDQSIEKSLKIVISQSDG